MVGLFLIYHASFAFVYGSHQLCISIIVFCCTRVNQCHICFTYYISFAFAYVCPVLMEGVRGGSKRFNEFFMSLQAGLKSEILT